MGLIIRGVGTTSSRLRDRCARLPRVARRLATLGFVAESLWDSSSDAGFKSSQGAATTSDDGRIPAPPSLAHCRSTNRLKCPKGSDLENQSVAELPWSNGR